MTIGLIVVEILLLNPSSNIVFDGRKYRWDSTMVWKVLWGKVSIESNQLPNFKHGRTTIEDAELSGCPMSSQVVQLKCQRLKTPKNNCYTQ